MTDEMKAKRELLFSGSKNGYDRVDQQTLDAMEAYCRDYKSFLDHSKTERECTAHTVALAEAAGFIPYERGMALQPGDRVYRVNRKKSVMLAVIGRESLSEGAQIVACHIDSPRLDLKPHPIYEDSRSLMTNLGSSPSPSTTDTAVPSFRATTPRSCRGIATHWYLRTPP